MSKTRYTDNTLAADPPGGKQHTVTSTAERALPREKPRKAAAKRRPAPDRTSAKKRSPARTTATKRSPVRKTAAKKAKR